MDDLVKKLRIAAEKATPGPWYVEKVKGYTIDYVKTKHPDHAPTENNKHRNLIAECQQRVYQARETANFNNLKTGGNSNSGYILQGDINNNRAKISCENDTVLIVVAGNDPKTVNRLRNSIYQNMGFR